MTQRFKNSTPVIRPAVEENLQINNLNQQCLVSNNTSENCTDQTESQTNTTDGSIISGNYHGLESSD